MSSRKSHPERPGGRLQLATLGRRGECALPDDAPEIPGQHQKLDSIRRSVGLAELRDAPTDRDSKGPARFAQEFGLGADDDGGVEKKRGR